uniref:Chitin-binding type-2 domain-containing protein n=1 Tax=Panagrellus redivivus TaxID=6233 RepID=A0A7E4UY56_PANRE
MFSLTIVLAITTVVHGYMPYQCREIRSPLIKKGVEKCFNDQETGGQQNDIERTSMLDAVNMFRGMIANQCDKFKSGPPKSVSNYPKVTYNCQYEADSYFECPAEMEDFESNSSFYRGIDVVNYATINRPVLWRMTPYITQTYIDPDTQVVNEFESVKKRPLRKIMSLLLNPLATEIGCFVRTCKFNDRDFDLIACKNGFPISGEDALYPVGSRCQKNEDCTLIYGTCDNEYGLCEKAPMNSTTPGGSTTVYQSTTEIGTTVSTTTEITGSVEPSTTEKCENESEKPSNSTDQKHDYTTSGSETTSPMTMESGKNTLQTTVQSTDSTTKIGNTGHTSTIKTTTSPDSTDTEIETTPSATTESETYKSSTHVQHTTDSQPSTTQNGTISDSIPAGCNETQQLLNQINANAQGFVLEITQTVRVIYSPVIGNLTVN